VTATPQAGDLRDPVEEALRFAVPWRAEVAVVAAPGARPVGLGGRRAVHALERGDDAPARLEVLVERGCEYLVVPADSLPWLDSEPDLSEHLGARYTPIARDEDACAVYSLHPRGERDTHAPDGLPLPPAYLIRLTSGCVRQAQNNPARMYEAYLESGALGARCIRSALDRHGLDIAAFDSILDFGCGCGRIVRHWHALEGPRVHGCDYNPYLTGWCARALPFADFRPNGLEPRLPYEDGQFDFLYAVSILTHLDEPLQLPWIAELARVVRPGGSLLLTVSGESRARHHLEGPPLDRFLAGELVVTRAALSGTNACAVYHPEAWLREHLEPGLALVDLVPDGAEDVRQDQVLLRRPAG
jgi:SAM-dependent methyltransferase